MAPRRQLPHPPIGPLTYSDAPSTGSSHRPSSSQPFPALENYQAQTITPSHSHCRGTFPERWAGDSARQSHSTRTNYAPSGTTPLSTSQLNQRFLLPGTNGQAPQRHSSVKPQEHKSHHKRPEGDPPSSHSRRSPDHRSGRMPWGATRQWQHYASCKHA